MNPADTEASYPSREDKAASTEALISVSDGTYGQHGGLVSVEMSSYPLRELLAANTEALYPLSGIYSPTSSHGVRSPLVASTEASYP
jgi:hypothetical protein